MLPNALKIVVAGAALIAVANRVGAADEKMQEKMVLLPSAVKWGDPPPTLPKGTKLTVLTGDPSQPGAFVLRVYFPANTLVAPHTHKTAENLTVISGELYHQMGEKLDRNCGDQMKQGAFVYLPAMMPQSVWTKGENAVVQVTGTGPFGLDYINPAEPICVIRCAASLNGASDHHMPSDSSNRVHAAASTSEAHLPHPRSPIETALPEATAPFTREETKSST